MQNTRRNCNDETQQEVCAAPKSNSFEEVCATVDKSSFEVPSEEDKSSFDDVLNTLDKWSVKSQRALLFRLADKWGVELH